MAVSVYFTRYTREVHRAWLWATIALFKKQPFQLKQNFRLKVFSELRCCQLSYWQVLCILVAILNEYPLDKRNRQSC